MKAALLVLGLASPVAAQDWPIAWDGYWRHINGACESATFYDGAVSSFETRCVGVSAQALSTPGAWEVVMDCDEEGRAWRASRVVLLGQDRMWIWFGPGGTIQEFSRCTSRDAS